MLFSIAIQDGDVIRDGLPGTQNLAAIVFIQENLHVPYVACKRLEHDLRSQIRARRCTVAKIAVLRQGNDVPVVGGPVKFVDEVADVPNAKVLDIICIGICLTSLNAQVNLFLQRSQFIQAQVIQERIVDARQSCPRKCKSRGHSRHCQHARNRLRHNKPLSHHWPNRNTPSLERCSRQCQQREHNEERSRLSSFM